jgi:hypothetical protein
MVTLQTSNGLTASSCNSTETELESMCFDVTIGTGLHSPALMSIPGALSLAFSTRRAINEEDGEGLMEADDDGDADADTEADADADADILADIADDEEGPATEDSMRADSSLVADMKDASMSVV